jgi:hypothetical protein
VKEGVVPKQNRVTPFGEIVATSDRGTFLGNRGVLHTDEGQIRREWQVKRWIVCVLEFRSRKRMVMTPGRYTELFFLDEATALAAGHRPCAECRHRRFIDFCTAWSGIHPRDDKSRPTADEIDCRLHGERLNPDRSKRSFVAAAEDLPDGTFVTVATSGEQPYLILGDCLLAWSPGGYCERRWRPKGEEVKVLTPPSTVQSIRAGYVPEIHPSAVALT